MISPQKLHLQEYLRSGKTLQDLTAEFAIRTYEHPSEPLVGFKYDQIDSPKYDALVRECRGIVLEKDSWRIVAKAFNRFYNIGELDWEFRRFDWDNFNVCSKEDGSLILLYNYKGTWRVNTSGSFGLGEISHFDGNWSDLFWKTAPFTINDLNFVHPDQTLVFELCTPFNKVVRPYRPTVFLLSVFDHQWQDSHYPSVELEPQVVDDYAKQLGVKRPMYYHFSGQEEVRQFLIDMQESDHTFEGVVLCDSNKMRYKWKTSTYVALHHMKDNGNCLHPKRLVPIVLANEHHETMIYMPECKTALLETARILDESYQDLLAKWEVAKGAPDQKSFALLVKDHPMSALLFNLRKDDSGKTLKALWKESEEFLVKRLFGDKTFNYDIVEVDAVLEADAKRVEDLRNEDDFEALSALRRSAERRAREEDSIEDCS